MIKKSYNVIGMHCTSCPLIIESDLEDIGVKSSCSYARQTLDVEFDDSRIAEGKISDVVRSSGYELSPHVLD
ncbi:MAG: heavy-metal-associated domain-containing protein [Candidatus Gottesmanbacteria bacterium]|nr:heavy-metal-associated domain-containing protein [Candidatus Gottesmanbacteria bacterium]